ncbi:hypothetical protein CASFOL_007613 [Castilleja foliolosa]|uniref:Uncharacterized protein n=1 Tax=Castilleja foliolosa TaxID=1961234 RepID=A0ABD3E531_9LAMI
MISLTGAEAEQYRAWLASGELSTKNHASGHIGEKPPLLLGNQVGGNMSSNNFQQNVPKADYYQTNVGAQNYINMQHPPVPPKAQYYPLAPNGNVQLNYGGVRLFHAYLYMGQQAQPSGLICIGWQFSYLCSF